MAPVEEYERVRQAHRQKHLSIRELARGFHHSRGKIREILAHAEPKPYQRRPLPSVLDPFNPLIHANLQEDEHAPRKQRHTAAKIFRRHRDEHDYRGSYQRVRLYLLSQGVGRCETFIPLDHDPGQRLERDFGHIYVDFPFSVPISSSRRVAVDAEAG
jgi:hypothetical protein